MGVFEIAAFSRGTLGMAEAIAECTDQVKRGPVLLFFYMGEGATVVAGVPYIFGSFFCGGGSMKAESYRVSATEGRRVPLKFTDACVTSKPLLSI